MKACEYLVVDSVGFLRSAPLAELADHVVSLAEVVAEIKDAAARMRLQALPVPVEYKEPDCDDIKQGEYAFGVFEHESKLRALTFPVTDFSRLTGDYPSLSATDIKVLATTLMLEKRHVGVDHIRSEPICKPTVNFGRPQEAPLGKLAGFYKPTADERDDEEDEEKEPEQISKGKEVRGKLMLQYDRGMY
jgi:RNA-binding protein NOB1